MSRIFEALQRSESERTGAPLAPPALATELLQAVERETIVQVPEDIVATKFTDNDFTDSEFTGTDCEHFPSLPISISPSGKLISLTAQDSLGAEKFRFLAVRLRQLQQSRPLKKVLITSTIPEEGKSTVAANLAVILGKKRQHRVLLVEGDLRRPTLSKELGVGKIAGLSEWLKGEPRPIANIYRLESANLWFLPAGDPPENPLELMQSGRLSELMKKLTDQFDWIVIDSPPVLPLADTSVWARLADGILLVTREGTTKRRLLQKGLQVLEQSKLLGAVLNSSSNTDHSNYYQRYGAGAANQAVPPSGK